MTHNELLTKIEKQTVHIANKIKPVADSCEKDIGGFANALRAVVELHEPAIVIYPKEMQILMCMECGDEEGLRYPCPTIQAIEKELA